MEKYKHFTTQKLDSIVKDLLKSSPDNKLVDEIIEEIENRVDNE